MRRMMLLLALILAAGLLVACAGAAAPTPTPLPGLGLANPASQNCLAVGGTLQIESGGDGGEFGVCYFDDNRQCEEWALLRGDCPVGGVKVTGYITPAGRFCAISGGEYTVTQQGDEQTEQGTCALPDGRTCDAWDLYNGLCSTAE